MIGGILLYPSALTENANNIYPSSAVLPVAYASNDTVRADVAALMGASIPTYDVPVADKVDDPEKTI
jgi:hypothetical protein